MKRYLKSGVVLVAGFLGAAAATGYTDHDPATDRKPDVRESVLRKFLQEASAPVAKYAATFIEEADAHNLDSGGYCPAWRLWVERRSKRPPEQHLRLGQAVGFLGSRGNPSRSDGGRPTLPGQRPEGETGGL